MQFLISVLYISALQLFRQTKNLFLMNFLLSLFSCGSSQPSKQGKYVSSLCIDGNQKNPVLIQKGKDKDGCLMIRTLTNSSKPISSMSQIVAKKLPQTKYAILRGCFSNKQKEISWGDLVGVVNYNSKLSHLIPNSTFKLKIGRNQEISSFGALRPYALDWLVVYWAELQGNYSIKDFVRCRQPLIFVVEDWQALLKLIHIYEEEMLKYLGDYCLLESKNKIFFYIITFENKYVILFEQSQQIRQHTRQILEKSIAVSNLAEEDFNLLLEKMTLNDYVDLQRDPALMGRKVRQYLNEIQRQKIQKQKPLPEAQPAIDPIYLDNLSQREQPIHRKQSKQSDAQLEAQYFASIRKQKEGKNQQELPGINEQEQILKIYELNNTSDIQQSDQIQTQQVSRPFNLYRKIRSKSQDANYVPDIIMDLDDEFYQKYS